MKAIVGALCFTFLLAGCGKDPRIAVLEDRVTALEAKLNKLEATTNTEQAAKPERIEAQAAVAVPAAAPAPLVEASRPDFEVVSAALRTGEVNASWTRFSYVATIRNNTGRAATAGGQVLWLDGDGFTIDSTPIRETLPTGESSITGEALITANQVPRVRTVKIKFD
jgi:outer membrane murein-binding lipoprotein Lpp